MQINAISPTKTGTVASFTARNDRNDLKKNPLSQKPEPMVKIPYSALMGLLMLASTTVGTTGCCKDDDEDIFPITEQQDTIVTSKPVQKEMSDMLSLIGVTPISSKSLSAATGDIVEYSYYDKSEGSNIVGKINLEESDENKVVYDETLTDRKYGDKGYQRKIWTKTDDGLMQKLQACGESRNAFSDIYSYRFEKSGNKIIQTCIENGNKGEICAGSSPNNVTAYGIEDNMSNIVVIKK